MPRLAIPARDDVPEASKPILTKHQELMWEVGELLGQWEMLQSELSDYEDVRN